MTKRKVVIEIDVPEFSDPCISQDVSGFQIFSEAIIQYAMLGATKTLSVALQSSKNLGVPYEEDHFVKFIQKKVDITSSAKMVAYINDNEEYVEFDPERFEFKTPRQIQE